MSSHFEDMMLYSSIRSGTNAKEVSNEAQKREQLAKRATVALKTRDNHIATLQRQLTDTALQRNELHASGASAARALEDACKEIAKLSGRPLEDVRAQFARQARTGHYNRLIGEYVEKGFFESDPRLDKEIQSREWYQPS